MHLGESGRNVRQVQQDLDAGHGIKAFNSFWQVFGFGLLHMNLRKIGATSLSQHQHILADINTNHTTARANECRHVVSEKPGTTSNIEDELSRL